MSIENITNIGNLVHQEKLLSRAELLLSNAPYPYRDKDTVLEFVSDYIKRAIQGYDFCHADFDASVSHNFHLDSLEPITSSLSALPKTLKDREEEVNDRELEPMVNKALHNILDTVQDLKAGNVPKEPHRQFAQEFLEMLVESTGNRTTTELLSDVFIEERISFG